MKTSIGGAWIFQLVIVFMLLFVSFLVVSLNYSKTFRLQNEVVDIIERSEGLTDQISTDGRSDGGIQLIANYLTYSGYNVKGYCQDGYYGAISLDGNGSDDFELAKSDTKYYYCFRKQIVYFDKKTNMAYYDIDMFFSFDLPVLGNLFTFRVSGQTLEIEHTYDDSKFNI